MPDEPKIKADCATCRFSIERPRNPQNILQRVMECRAMPPAPIAFTTSRGVTVSALWPTVEAGQMCFSYLHDPAKIGSVPPMEAANDGN